MSYYAILISEARAPKKSGEPPGPVLDGAEDDLLRMSCALEFLGYSVRRLTDEEVSVDRIRKELENLPKGVKVLWVHWMGHGTLRNDDVQLTAVAEEAQYITLDKIGRLLNTLDVRECVDNIVLTLDACWSALDMIALKNKSDTYSSRHSMVLFGAASTKAAYVLEGHRLFTGSIVRALFRLALATGDHFPQAVGGSVTIGHIEVSINDYLDGMHRWFGAECSHETDDHGSPVETPLALVRSSSERRIEAGANMARARTDHLAPAYRMLLRSATCCLLARPNDPVFIAPQPGSLALELAVLVARSRERGKDIRDEDIQLAIKNEIASWHEWPGISPDMKNRIMRHATACELRPATEEVVKRLHQLLLLGSGGWCRGQDDIVIRKEQISNTVNVATHRGNLLRGNRSDLLGKVCKLIEAVELASTSPVDYRVRVRGGDGHRLAAVVERGAPFGIGQAWRRRLRAGEEGQKHVVVEVFATASGQAVAVGLGLIRVRWHVQPPLRMGQVVDLTLTRQSLTMLMVAIKTTDADAVGRTREWVATMALEATCRTSGADGTQYERALVPTAYHELVAWYDACRGLAKTEAQRTWLRDADEALRSRHDLIGDMLDMLLSDRDDLGLLVARALEREGVPLSGTRALDEKVLQGIRDWFDTKGRALDEHGRARVGTLIHGLERMARGDSASRVRSYWNRTPDGQEAEQVIVETMAQDNKRAWSISNIIQGVKFRDRQAIEAGVGIQDGASGGVTGDQAAPDIKELLVQDPESPKPALVAPDETMGAAS